MIDETFSAALKDALVALSIAEFYLGGDVPEGLPPLDRKALEGGLDIVLPAVLDELEKAEEFAEDFQIEQPDWKSYHFDLVYDETQTVLWAGVFFVHGTPGYGRIFIERCTVARLADDRYVFWGPQEEEDMEDEDEPAQIH